MIVVKLDDIAGTERQTDTENWSSRRLLLRREGMGFSMHDTIIKPGTETHMCYANHLEAVYCIEGRGLLIDRETGKEYEIVPGTLYALDKHDQHTLKVYEELRLICVFNPPLTGKETHDETGAYPLIVEDEGSAAA